jgi:hypothetical protein
MSSEPAAREELVELMDVQHVQQGIDADSFSAAAIVEEGRRRNNLPSGDSTTDNPTLRTRTPKVKITPWRLVNTFLILGLGIYKATATYRGQDTTPTTLDWIIGVLWALMCVWICYEHYQISNGLQCVLGVFPGGR